MDLRPTRNDSSVLGTYMTRSYLGVLSGCSGFCVQKELQGASIEAGRPIRRFIQSSRQEKMGRELW